MVTWPIFVCAFAATIFHLQYKLSISQGQSWIIKPGSQFCPPWYIVLWVCPSMMILGHLSMIMTGWASFLSALRHWHSSLLWRHLHLPSPPPFPFVPSAVILFNDCYLYPSSQVNTASQPASQPDILLTFSSSKKRNTENCIPFLLSHNSLLLPSCPGKAFAPTPLSADQSASKAGYSQKETNLAATRTHSNWVIWAPRTIIFGLFWEYYDEWL